jgi:hypothetical protein
MRLAEWLGRVARWFLRIPFSRGLDGFPPAS